MEKLPQSQDDVNEALSEFFGNPQSVIQDYITESVVESAMQPQYGKWAPKKLLTRGQKKLLKKKAGKQQKMEMEEINLQIEQARQ